MDEAARYHVARKGAKQGIFTVDEIRQGLVTGRFLPTDHCWTNGMGPWISLSQLLASPAIPATVSSANPGSAPAATAGGSPPSSRNVAQASASPRRPASLGWRCLSCKNSFAQPNSPTSGYSTLWKSFGYFVGSLACFIFGMVLCGGLSAMASALGGGAQHAGNIVVGLLGVIFLLASMVLSFMSAFEFVSAAVHHGIYRSGQPGRCPHCTSTLILRG